MKGQNKYASHLDTCEQASIFFYSKGEVTLSVNVNRNEKQTRTFLATDDLQEMQVDGNIGSVRWTVDEADSTLFYGLAMDGKKELSWIISLCAAVRAYPCVLFLCG